MTITPGLEAILLRAGRLPGAGVVDLLVVDGVLAAIGAG